MFGVVYSVILTRLGFHLVQLHQKTRPKGYLSLLMRKNQDLSDMPKSTGQWVKDKLRVTT